LDSFNYFLNVGLKRIVNANKKVQSPILPTHHRVFVLHCGGLPHKTHAAPLCFIVQIASSVDERFYIQYTDIYVKEPKACLLAFFSRRSTPFFFLFFLLFCLIPECG